LMPVYPIGRAADLRSAGSPKGPAAISNGRCPSRGIFTTHSASLCSPAGLRRRHGASILAKELLRRGEYTPGMDVPFPPINAAKAETIAARKNQKQREKYPL